MTIFWMIGVVSTLGIGAVMAGITFWLGSNRLSRAAGVSLVFAFCLAYHVVAGLGMGVPILRFLMPTIIVPFGFGFGGGDLAFFIALVLQSILAGLAGIGVYYLLNRRRNREQSAGERTS